jgi:tripartite-type tricarboxylate transporter receptor subunit TctC
MMLRWVGVLAPPGTKTDIGAGMNSDINQALRQPEIRERLENVGFEPAPGSDAEFAAFLRNEVEKRASIVRAAGIKQD